MPEKIHLWKIKLFDGVDFVNDSFNFLKVVDKKCHHETTVNTNVLGNEGGVDGLVDNIELLSHFGKVFEDWVFGEDLKGEDVELEGFWLGECLLFDFEEDFELFLLLGSEFTDVDNDPEDEMGFGPLVVFFIFEVRIGELLDFF